MKIIVVCLCLGLLSACATPHYVDGTKAAYIPDKCDPHGPCNVGKMPV